MTMNTRRKAAEMDDYAILAPGVSLQVIVKWGVSTLDVLEKDPPLHFVLGTEGNAEASDFVVPEGTLVGDEFELVHVSGDKLWLCVPPDAKATVRWTENGSLVSEELLPRYGLLPEQALPEQGAVRRVLLPMNGRGVVHVGAFSFFVHLGERAKLPVSAQPGFVDTTVASFFGASLCATLGLLGVAAFFVPPMGLTDGDDIQEERVLLMRQYLESQAERERLQEPSAETGSSGERAADPAPGESGKLGKFLPKAPSGLLSRKMNKQPERSSPPSRAEAIEEARTFGTISILTASAFNRQTSATFGRSSALGEADRDLLGDMFGPTLGEQVGSGLALSGNGERGGVGHGIDMGAIGDREGLNPLGPGHFIGQRSLGPHRTSVPRVTPSGVTKVTGRLPPELIQRTVRQNYGRFRMCYERGLAKNPNLTGRIAVRFAIDSEGRVMHASAGESSLPDSEVVSCVVSAYFGLTFPAREQGIVTVVYPIAFSPE